MKCFNCGYLHNAKNAKACAICGADFSMKCGNCHEPNPKEAKFCFNCGSKLDFIESNKALESKKNIAVMFADISGFTKLSEQYSAEQVRNIINEAFEYITKPIYELEGSIDKYIGDCVMVLFGDKYIHQDDPLRSVKCALKMQEAINNYSKEKLSKYDIDLKLSIGINYGTVVSGNVGSYYDQDYTVIGDVVNTAQRLQTSAPSASILVSESIYNQTKEYIDYGVKQSIRVKNKENEVICYKPISLNTASDVITLISRDNELALLNEYFINYNHISIIGESGIGKSTLVKAFISNLDTNHRKLWIDTNIIYKNKPFSLIKNIISSILNINPFDSNRIKKNRLNSFVDYILDSYSEEDIIKNYNYIALVLNLELDLEYKEIINYTEYEDLLREIKTQLEIFFNNLALKQNILLILDDLQFSDLESIDILSNIDLNIKVISISKFELDLYNGEISISLDKFDINQTKELITYIVNDINIDKSFINTVYNITDGNIMYIKEITNSIKRNNQILNKDNFLFINPNYLEKIPKTLSNTILANILELDSKVYEILSVCSVIGNEFNLNYVFEILKLDFNEELLNIPIKMGIIGFKNILKHNNDNHKIYAFKQDMIREVIYNNILENTKKEYHELIARLYIHHNENELEEYYEIIAYHYEHTDHRKQTINYYMRAANHSYDNYSYNSSLHFYKKVTELCDLSTNIYHAYNRMGEIYSVIGMYDEAIEAYNKAIIHTSLDEQINEIILNKIEIYRTITNFDEALKLIDELDSKLSHKSHLFGKLLSIKATVFNMLGKKEVIELATTSESILSTARDYEALAQTMMQAGIRYSINGDLEESIDYLLKAYDYANKSSNKTIIIKSAINLGITYHHYGEINKAFVYLEKAINLAKEISNIKNIITASLNLGVFNLEKGYFNKALVLFDSVIEDSKQVNLVYQLCIALTNKGDLLYELGEYENAYNLYEEALDITTKYEIPIENAINILGMAKTKIMIDNLDIIPLLEKALKIFKDANEIGFISDVYLYYAQHYLKLDQKDEAIEALNTAILNAEKTHNTLKIIQTKRLLSEITNNINLLNEVINLFDNFESNYELAKTYYSLYKLNHNDSDLERAKAYISEVDNCLYKEIINKK